MYNIITSGKHEENIYIYIYTHTHTHTPYILWEEGNVV